MTDIAAMRKALSEKYGVPWVAKKSDDQVIAIYKALKAKNKI